MLTLQSGLVEMLRSLARRGEQPSVMLRSVVAQLEPEMANRQHLVLYFSTAFCFKDGQAYKIFGWFPDGSGPLKDPDIDRLLFKRIQETRAEWDRPDVGPAGTAFLEEKKEEQ
jgi:hypothetical protein